MIKMSLYTCWKIKLDMCWLWKILEYIKVIGCDEKMSLLCKNMRRVWKRRLPLAGGSPQGSGFRVRPRLGCTCRRWAWFKFRRWMAYQPSCWTLIMSASSFGRKVIYNSFCVMQLSSNEKILSVAREDFCF